MPKPRVKAGTSKSAVAERKKSFARAYIANGRNGTQAAITAGFSPKGADVVAARLLGDARVSSLVAELTEKHSAAAGVSVDRTLQEVSTMAYVDPTAEGVKVKYTEKLAALEMLMKHQGLYKKDNKQKAPNVSINVVLE